MLKNKYMVFSIKYIKKKTFFQKFFQKFGFLDQNFLKSQKILLKLLFFLQKKLLCLGSCRNFLFQPLKIYVGSLCSAEKKALKSKKNGIFWQKKLRKNTAKILTKILTKFRPVFFHFFL